MNAARARLSQTDGLLPRARQSHVRDPRSRALRAERTVRAGPRDPSLRSHTSGPDFPTSRVDSSHPPTPTAAVVVCRSYTESVRALALNSESAPARVPKHHPFGPSRPRPGSLPRSFFARGIFGSPSPSSPSRARAIGCRLVCSCPSTRINLSAGCHRERRICSSFASRRINCERTRDLRVSPQDPVE